MTDNPQKVIVESAADTAESWVKDRFEPNTLDDAVIQYTAAAEPCRGCEHRGHCAQFRLACESFVTWVDTCKTGNRPRLPNATSYMFLYPEDIQGKPAGDPIRVRRSRGTEKR
jgi:hypothetical protein